MRLRNLPKTTLLENIRAELGGQYFRESVDLGLQALFLIALVCYPIGLIIFNQLSNKESL